MDSPAPGSIAAQREATILQGIASRTCDAACFLPVPLVVVVAVRLEPAADYARRAIFWQCDQPKRDPPSPAQSPAACLRVSLARGRAAHRRIGALGSLRQLSQPPKAGRGMRIKPARGSSARTATGGSRSRRA